MVSPRSDGAASAQALASLRATAEAADGLVRVTIEQGEIAELSIKPEAMRLTADELADYILTALRQAFTDASGQVANLLDVGPAGDTASLDRARSEIERVSAEVSQQLEDVYQRLNRLMGDTR